MTYNDGIIVASSNPGAEAAAVVLLKIFLCGYKDLCRRIKPQELRGPLLCQVIGHHEHGFAAQAQAFALHGGSNHFVG